MISRNIKNFVDGLSPGSTGGFSIIEVVIAIGIITVGMLGVSSLVVQNIQVQKVNHNFLVASMLSQEGLELTRNIRDENWLTLGNDWQADLTDTDGTFVIDYRGRPSIDDTPDTAYDAGARLYADGQDFYTHASAGTSPTIFYRLITVTDAGDHVAASSTVKWTDRSAHEYTAETYLYDWR